MQVEDSIWFTSSAGTVGIVKVKTSGNGTKFYIGTGTGLSQEDDESFIADHGAPIPPQLIKGFFGV